MTILERAKIKKAIIDNPKMKGRFNFSLTNEEQEALKEEEKNQKKDKESVLLSDILSKVTLMKGDKGDIPTEKELLSIIKPLIPQVKDGKTPTKQELLELILPLIPKVKDGRTPTKEELLDLIYQLIPKIENGKTPTKSEITALIKPLIPVVKDGSPDTGEEIVDKINELPTDDDDFKIDAKHIKNLPRGGGGGGGRFGLGSVDQVDLTSQCNGSNKTFNVPGHSIALSLESSSFPFSYRKTVDYTSSGLTLQLTSEVSAPAQGTTLNFIFVR